MTIIDFFWMCLCERATLASIYPRKRILSPNEGMRDVDYDMVRCNSVMYCVCD